MRVLLPVDETSSCMHYVGNLDQMENCCSQDCSDGTVDQSDVVWTFCRMESELRCLLEETSGTSLVCLPSTSGMRIAIATVAVSGFRIQKVDASESRTPISCNTLGCFVQLWADLVYGE